MFKEIDILHIKQNVIHDMWDAWFQIRLIYFGAKVLALYLKP
jgi:hypothetical protein